MLECRAMIEPQAQKRGIGMSFPRFDTPCFVKADRTRIKQVLINLLFNAIKYNTPGGTVVRRGAAGAAGHSLRISVRDTGAGLSPEQLAQLFQPFNRLGKESRRRGRHRHRPGGDQAAGRADGRRHRRR
jgi:signal transduction histidine kinase